MKFASVYEPAVWLTSVANGALLLALLVVPSEGAPEDRSPEAMPHAVVETHDLMELFNQPLYRHLKQAMQQEPTGEQGWKTIRQRGMQAAEVANLVALRKSDPQWQQLTGELQQAGLKLAETAESKDFAATEQAYRSLLDRCNACHQAMAPGHAPQLEP